MLACTESHLFREYIGENEFLSKTILTCLSGAQKCSIHEMKKWQKNRDTATLSDKLICKAPPGDLSISLTRQVEYNTA